MVIKKTAKKVSNEKVLDMVKVNKKLLHNCKKRMMAYCGHVLEHASIIKDIILGRVPGKRSRGRQLRIWMPDIKEWSELPLSEISRKASERTVWKRMLVHDLHFGDVT